MQKDCVMLTTDPTFAYFTYLFYFYFLPIYDVISLDNDIKMIYHFIEWQPSTQSPCQNQRFVSTSRKLLKNRN